METKKFRASYGLDSGGEKIINVATSNLSHPNDAVNVDLFIKENTVQEYSSTRTYETGFVVKYNNRLYQNVLAVTTPEQFNDAKWKSIATDINYRRVLSTSGSNGNLNSGDAILSAVVAQDATYVLPFDASINTPLSGESVTIYDEAGVCNEYQLIVSGNGKLINGQTSYRITRPRSRTVFVYNGNQWIANTIEPETHRGRLVSLSDYTPSRQFIQMAAGDKIMRQSRFEGDLVLRLPRYANHGDMIYTADVDALNHRNRAIMDVHPDSGHTITINFTLPPVQRAVSSAGGGFGQVIYDANANTWRIFDGDVLPRWKVIQNNYQCVNKDLLIPYSRSNTKTIDITFPPRVAVGDSISISMAHMIAGSKVRILIPTQATDTFLFGDIDTLENPQLSTVQTKYNNPENLLSKTLTLTADGSDRTWTFVYQEKTLFFPDKNAWVNTVVERTDYRVDASNPTRFGIAAIATQVEVNKNAEQIDSGKNKRDSEAFVTPETLANKRATTVNRGIVRAATSAESLATSGTGEAWDNVFITPQLFNDRLSTTSRRGVARLATQAQTNAMSGSGETWTSVIVTPQTLNGRVASESQTGLSQVVAFGGTKQTNRLTKGTGVHDFDEHYKYVTPKTLFEKVSTEVSQGMGFVATQAETNAGTVDNVNGPLFVTAQKLHARQATTTLTGLTRAATNAETLSNTPTVGNNIHVTPSELVKRTSTEIRWGLSETATQVEVDAGTLHDQYFVTPKTFGHWLNRERLTVNVDSGLTTNGVIWTGQSFDIQVATETQRGTLRMATQAEANGSGTGGAANTVITPAKLHGRTSTTSRTGIAALATQAEVDAGTVNNKIVTPQTLRVVSDARYVNLTGDKMTGGLIIDHADGLILTNPSNSESWGALRTGEYTDGLGNTTTENDTSIWTRHRAGSSLKNINAVFKDAGGLLLYGPSDRKVIFDVHPDGAISNRIGIYSRIEAGPLYFRPNGISSSSNQATLSTNGSLSSQQFVSLTGDFRSDTNKVLRLIPSNDITKSVDITAAGNVTTKANLTVENNVTLGDNLNVGKSAIINTSLEVKTTSKLVGAVTLDNTFTVAGKSTLNGALETNTNTINFNRVAGNALSIKMSTPTTNGGIGFESNGDVSFSPDRSNGIIKFRPSGINSSTNEILVRTTGLELKNNQHVIADASPTQSSHLTNKRYVDDAIDGVTLNSGNRVSKSGDTMTGPLTINSATALTANGEVTVKDLLTVSQLRIDVGNGEFVEIRPNRQNYTIEFVWISN